MIQLLAECVCVCNERGQMKEKIESGERGKSKREGGAGRERERGRNSVLV